MMNRFDYERAICSSTLPPLARWILTVLAQIADFYDLSIPQQWMPSHRALMRRTGIDTKDTMIKYLRLLEQTGWIRCKRGGGAGHTNEYELTIPLTHSDQACGQRAGDAGPLSTEKAGDAGPSGPERVEHAGPSGPKRVEHAGPSISIDTDHRIHTPRSGVSPPVTSGELPADLIKIIIEEVHNRTGRQIGPCWAARVGRELFARAGTVGIPANYLRASIRRERQPRERFLSLYDQSDQK